MISLLPFALDVSRLEELLVLTTLWMKKPKPVLVSPLSCAAPENDEVGNRRWFTRMVKSGALYPICFGGQVSLKADLTGHLSRLRHVQQTRPSCMRTSLKLMGILRGMGDEMLLRSHLQPDRLVPHVRSCCSTSVSRVTKGVRCVARAIRIPAVGVARGGVACQAVSRSPPHSHSACGIVEAYHHRRHCQRRSARP